MNCEGFENVVNDLAREQIMEATLREEAIHHSADCQRCAERFRDELQLTNDLRHFADQVRHASVSASIEASLLSQFGSHLGLRTIPPQVPLKTSNRYLFYAAPIAAVLLILAGLIAIRFRSREEALPVQTAALNADTPGSQNPPVNATDSRASGHIAPVKKLKSAPGKLSKVKGSRTTVAVEVAKLVAVNIPEVTTDFIPIGYSTASNVQEGGQLVRVELPRSTMAQFGLPVNMERYDERVKADVWVGADGLARAIRFVQ